VSDRASQILVVSLWLASIGLMVGLGAWQGAFAVILLVAFAALCVFGAAAGLARASDPSQRGGDE